MHCLLPNVIIITKNPNIERIENPSYFFEKAVRLQRRETLKAGYSS